MPHSTTAAASARIARWLGISPRALPDQMHRLETSFKFQGMRIRAVSLPETWWQQAGLPLLAYREDQAVALLPARGGYRFWESDLQQGRVDSQYARQISPQAFACYRIFDNQPLTLWQVVRFGWQGTHYDLALLCLSTGLIAASTLAIPGLITGLMWELHYIWVLASLLILLYLLFYSQGLSLRRVITRVNVAQQAALWDRVLRSPVPPEIVSLVPAFTVQPYLSLGLAFINLLIFAAGAGWCVAPIPVLVAVALPLILTLLFWIKPQSQVERAYQHWLGQTMQHLIRLRLLSVPIATHWQQKYRPYRQQHQRLLNNSSGLTLLLALVAPLWVGLFYKQVEGIEWLLIYFFMTAVLKFFHDLMSVVRLNHQQLIAWISLPPAEPFISEAVTLSGKLRVENLSYGTIRNLTFTVMPGNMVFITGSAKTTLLRILLGIVCPESGSVFYDDHPSGRATRSQIGSYFEESKIHAGSILANIAGFRPLSIDAALEAARLAVLEDWIKTLPMGIHTLLDEGGQVISQGQRQRILLARALAHHPRFLLLDNPVHALDHETRQRIMYNLQALPATKIIALDEVVLANTLIIHADR